MIKVTSSLVLSLIILVALNGLSRAEVYKWVDKNGKIHYSDRKMNSSAEELNISTGTSTLGSNSVNNEDRQEQREKLLNSYEVDRAERKEKRELEKQEKQKQKRYCTALKDQLRGFEEERAIWYDLDEETGERKYISDDELENRISDLRKEISSNCS